MVGDQLYIFAHKKQTFCRPSQLLWILITCSINDYGVFVVTFLEKMSLYNNVT